MTIEAEHTGTSPSVSVDISVMENEWPDFEKVIKSAVKTALTHTSIHPSPSAEPLALSVVLADNDFVRDLNRQYRNKDKPTNVLSFPQDHDDLFGERNLGDIILAYETVRDEAAAQNKSLEHHTLHMIIHGLLHLLGHDHEDDAQAEEMENLERLILRDLGIKNPYEFPQRL